MRKLTFILILLLAVVFSLPALTQGAWSVTQVSTGGVNYNVFTCTVTSTTSDTIAATTRTPLSLDTTRPWTLIANATGETIDGTGTVPVVLYTGYSTSSAITGYASGLRTDVVSFKTVEADVVSSAGTVLCDPNLDTADVTDVRAMVPPAPYYIATVTGTGVLAAADIVFKIIQPSRY